MNRVFLVSWTVAGSLLFAACASITTETGSTDQRSRTSEITASKMRSDWAMATATATPSQLGRQLANLIDRAAVSYESYSRQIAGNWRQGNEGRGTPVLDTEMQRQVPNWIAGEEPTLKAYDDMVDFAINRIRTEDLYGTDGQELIQEMVTAYYQLYSAVVYPKGTVGDYEFAVGSLVSRVSGLSDRVVEEMDRYE